jgi:hypothetical protein
VKEHLHHYSIVGAIVLGLPAIAGCVENLDPSAIAGSGSAQASTVVIDGGSDDGGGAGGDGGGGGDAGAGLPLCMNGNFIDPDLGQGPAFCTDNDPNNVFPDPITPMIELPDGATTMNPCDAVEAQSLTIRQTYCASCHESPGDPQAPYHDILDDNYANGGGYTLPDGGPTLFATVSSFKTSVGLDGGPAYIIYPGDHVDSELYQLVAKQNMPPQTAGMTPVYPNQSEVALLGAWIDSVPLCFSQFQNLNTQVPVDFVTPGPAAAPSDGGM